MVSNREAYEACRPDFIWCAAVGTVLKSAIDCIADRSVIIPLDEVLGEMKSVPACPTSNGIGISAVDTLATLKRRFPDRGWGDKSDNCQCGNGQVREIVHDILDLSLKACRWSRCEILEL